MVLRGVCLARNILEAPWRGMLCTPQGVRTRRRVTGRRGLPFEESAFERFTAACPERWFRHTYPRPAPGRLVTLRLGCCSSYTLTSSGSVPTSQHQLRYYAHLSPPWMPLWPQECDGRGAPQPCSNFPLGPPLLVSDL